MDVPLRTCVCACVAHAHAAAACTHTVCMMRPFPRPVLYCWAGLHSSTLQDTGGQAFLPPPPRHAHPQPPPPTPTRATAYRHVHDAPPLLCAAALSYAPPPMPPRRLWPQSSAARARPGCPTWARWTPRPLASCCWPLGRPRGSAGRSSGARSGALHTHDAAGCFGEGRGTGGGGGGRMQPGVSRRPLGAAGLPAAWLPATWLVPEPPLRMNAGRTLVLGRAAACTA